LAIRLVFWLTLVPTAFPSQGQWLEWPEISALAEEVYSGATASDFHELPYA